MKRSSMPRPSKGIRRTPIKKVNRARRARLFREDFDSPEFVAWIRSHPCGNCLRAGNTVAAHTRSRGAGGKASDVIPLCDVPQDCHGQYDRHELRPEQQAYLKSLAPYYWSRWLARRAEGTQE